MSRHRRELYRTLTKLLGHPVGYTKDRRNDVHQLLSGWLGQRRTRESRLEMAYNLPHPRDHDKPTKDRLVTEGWLYKQIIRSLGAFRGVSSFGHWHIEGRAYLKNLHQFQLPSHLKLKDLDLATRWDQIDLISRKCLKIAISPYYAKVVAALTMPDGKTFLSKKAVQVVWDYRSYEHMEVWQCRYWDFTCLGNDEYLWQQAIHHEGYLAKTATTIAIEPDFERAINAAKRKTVRQAVNSILQDYADEVPKA